LVLQALTDQKVHICVGLAAETTTSAARQVLAEAGFGVIDQASALEECGQDAERALELLRSGWTPARQMVRTSSNSSLDSLDAMPVSRCPFMAVTSSVAASSSAATSSANRWAGSAGEAPGFKGLDAISETARVLKESGSSDEEVQELLGIDSSALQAALGYDRFALAAQVLAKRRVPPEKIADKLNMSESRVHAVCLRGNELIGGRILGNNLQSRLDTLLKEEAELCCPVSLCLFTDPVIASDGHTYESISLKAIIRTGQPSPMTRERLEKIYFPAKDLKCRVIAYRERRTDELLSFVEDAVDEQPAMANQALERVVEYIDVLKPSNARERTARAVKLLERAGRHVPENFHI